MNLGNVLSCYCDRRLSTLSLMDEFESLKDGHNVYDTLKLTNIFTVMVDNYCLHVSLLIKRKPMGTKLTRDSLTFSKLKNEIMGKQFGCVSAPKYAITNEAYKGAKIILESADDNDTFFFQTPIFFGAQNSSNRTGYGNQYYGRDLVYEGTKYGEVTEYMCIGAEYNIFYVFPQKSSGCP